MRARDLRAAARQSLKGNWFAAIAVSFVAGLFSEKVYYSEGAFGQGTGYLSFLNNQIWTTVVTIAIVMTLLAIVVGGAVLLGQCKFFLNLVNEKNPRFGDLFSQFHRLWTGFCMIFLVNLFIILWSFLFVIPGIIAAYRYAMVPYLMAEFPELRVMEAMRESKRLMHGNKGRLFCLQLSFLGWLLLCACTMGIGMFWLSPYMCAAEAVFYMDVTGRGARYTNYSAWNDPRQSRQANLGPEF